MGLVLSPKGPPRWSEITALMGGTFDPPTLAHREAALGVLKNPGVKRVVILPNGNPPHKPTHASAEHRLNMCRLCFEPDMSIEPLEIASSKLQHYTFDSLTQLKQKYSPIAFVIGIDQLHDLRKWYRFPEVLDLCHWIVLSRKGVSDKFDWSQLPIQPQPGLPRDCHLLRGGTTLLVVPTEAPESSATEIRKCIALTGTPPNGQLPQNIEEYIVKMGLYGVAKK